MTDRFKNRKGTQKHKPDKGKGSYDRKDNYDKLEQIPDKDIQHGNNNERR